MSDNSEGLAETVADYKIGDGLVQNSNTIFGWVGFLTCRKKAACWISRSSRLPLHPFLGVV